MACNGTSPFLWRGKDEGSGRVEKVRVSRKTQL